MAAAIDLAAAVDARAPVKEPPLPESEDLCPVGRAHACVLDLQGTRAPAVPAGCLTEPWSNYLSFDQPGKLTNADGDRFWESVVTINLDPARGCGCAVFALDYDDHTEGFTVNIGDSPTNDGWGGDAGTTVKSAELQVFRTDLQVYSDAAGTKVDMMLSLRLPDLTGRALTLKVCDEALSFELDKGPRPTEPLWGKMNSGTFQHLFSLGTRSRTRDSETLGPPDYRIYAAFNRVIHVRDGAAIAGRVGQGLRRASIYLTP
jgi:hypothetical protein